MYTATRALFLKAMSGVHAGSGADLGIVDLPIQRERHTGFPKIESSGIKGAIREAFEEIIKNTEDFVKVAFGPEEKVGDDTKHSGAVAFTDARILLFPVRSARGVFAYATCPLVLSRLAEDFMMAGILPVKPVVEDAVVGSRPAEDFKMDGITAAPQTIEIVDKALVTSDALLINGKVILEEYTYDAEKSKPATEIAKRIAKWLGKPDDKYLKENLIILPNDEFADFVQNATEIITRIKIDEKTGTVAKGALFTEELLPTETVMYSLVMASSIFLSERERSCSETVKKANGNEGEYLLDTLGEKMPQYLQIGGNATIGKGLVSVSVVKGGN
jgi:CRISPR-associated protein Cmr4